MFVAAVGISLSVLKDAGNALKEAGSGTLFTPVGGLAKAFPYNTSRNPMYTCLLLVALPAFAALLDTAWPLIMMPMLYSYLIVVVAAEENMLLKEFGAEYEKYVESVPRWGIMGQ